MKPRSVADAIDLDVPSGDTPAPNPEAASDAIEPLVFTEEPAKPAPAIVPLAARPKRRTKAELEAEVSRLQAEIERKQAEAAASAPDLIRAMVNPLMLTFRAAGNIMASWKGEHWKLPDDEAKLLGEAWAPCVGPVLSKHPEAVLWASAIAVTYSVAYPRIQMDRTLALKKGEDTSEEPKP